MRLPLSLSLLALALPTTALAEDEAPPLSIYGFARLDVLANDSRMSSLDRPSFVEPEPAGGQLDSALTMTPQLSRVGLSIDSWQVTDYTFTGDGKLEIDFAGGDGTNAIRLRHAYGAITAKRRFELLIGQAADLASPLVPSAQNDSQLVYAGNLGDRRPQLRMSVMPTRKLVVAVAAAASGVLDRRDIDGDGQLDAIASAMPMLQWMVETHVPARRGSLVRLGLSGHLASEELADGTRTDGSSIAGHFSVPYGQVLALSGEGYYGTNLSDLGGGIGQGINMATGEPVRSLGGWLELAVFPTKRHMLAAGRSADVVRAADIEVGDRRRNTTTYGVLRYRPRPALQLGLEYLHWRTQYKQMSDGRANRFDLHFSVFF